MSLDRRTYMLQAPGLAFWPGLCLAVVVYGINRFGDALRDLLDPRLRGGVGRFGARPRPPTASDDSPREAGECVHRGARLGSALRYS